MTYRTDDEFDDVPDEEPGRGPLFNVIVAVMLVCLGSGTALASRALGVTLPSLPTFNSVAGVATPAAPAPEKPVGLNDFRALQQQIKVSVQSTERLLATQQAEIKRLTDQVAVLSGKLDLLQRPLASAQGAIPESAPKPVAHAPLPRKRPAAPRPAGAISTGGAPLPPPVALTR